MIEQIATVVAVEGGSAWVESQRQSACGACAMNQGCGVGIFARVFGFNSPQLKVTHIEGIEVGDRVVLGIDEQALVRGSFAAYIMPILFMLGFALLGDMLISRWLVALKPDVIVLLSGLIGLFVGLAWLNRHSRRIVRDCRYQPLILHKTADNIYTACRKSESHK